jgi:hypothetical protein
MAGYNAIYGKQILFFQDEVFSARAALDPPSDTDRLLRIEDLLSINSPRPAPQPDPETMHETVPRAHIETAETSSSENTFENIPADSLADFAP